LRIAIISVAPPYRGGIAAHTSQLIRELTKDKHSVSCYNFTRQYPDFLFPGKTQYLEPKEYMTESIECLDSVNPISWVRVGSNIKSNKFKLVILRYWNPFFAPMLVTISRVIKWKNPQVKLVSLFDNFIPHESQFYDRFFTKLFIHEMHGNIVQSKKVSDDIKKLYPYISVKKLFHPLYTKYGKSLDKFICRSKLKLNKKYIILYFGLVREYKGLDVLIRSVKKLKTIRDDFFVLAVGESYDAPEKLNKLINKLKINDVFDWQNKFIPDDEISLFFSSCDLVVLPYRSASQSGIVQIAYHFNKPVIVTNVGGLPEIVEIDKSGNIVEPDNIDSLTDQINSSLNDRKLEYMSNFINSYKERFSWNTFVNDMFKYIESL